MHQPLVSVIIPTYNRETYLRQAIESVAKQTYIPIEIIVVDDGSHHNYAQAICETFSNCQYYYKENRGVSSSRNFGVDSAKGDFIAFLDDDDLWTINKIEKQMQLLLNHSDIDLIHSAAYVIDALGKPTGKIIGASKNKVDKRSGYVFWNALGVWTVKASTPLIRRKVFSDVLFFDHRLKAGEDTDFYQRVFFKHKIMYLEDPLTFYRIYSNTNRLSLQHELYVGIEPIMFENIKLLGIRNPIILYKIATRILNLAINNRKKGCSEKSLKISKFSKFFRPQYCLNKYFKDF